MRRVDILVLFCAALLAECATAAVRPEILHHQRLRLRLWSNSSIDGGQEELPTTEQTIPRTALSELTGFFTTHEVLSTAGTVSAWTTHGTDGSLLSSQDSSTSSFSPSVPTAVTEAIYDDRTTGAPPATERIYTTGDPSRLSTLLTNSTINSSVACRNGDASACSSAVLSTNRRPVTPLATSSSLQESTSTEPCTPLPSDKPVTEYSIVYTSTITFYGSSTDYTPPYSPLVTPNFCSPTGEALITFFSTTRVTNSTATLTVHAPSSSASPSNDFMMPAPMPAPTFSIDLPEIITQTPDAAGKGGGGIIITMRPFLSFSRQVVTFITTDKNPSVVFAPEPTFDSGQPEVTGGLVDGNHKTVEETDDWQTRTIVPEPPESVKQSPVPTFQVTAGGDRVIIGSKTVSSLGPDQTATVTVGSEVFTILPTAVVGLGTTITKPAPQPTETPEPPAATGTLGGLPVIVSASRAVVVQDVTLTIPPQSATPTTTTINHQTVVLGAQSVVVGHETLLFPTPQPTHAIITGGQMLTAIGPSLLVLHSTTITYGPQTPVNSTTTINGEAISIGPSGISLHGTTLGGPSADPQATEYEIVGGITVGKALPSLVVLNGATYSLNQDGDSQTDFETTVVGGQTVTVGPRGLVVASVTLAYPGESVTATLSSTGVSREEGFPVETRLGTAGGEDGDGENGAGLGRGRVNVCGVLGVSVMMAGLFLA
ncbi:hypothetical protein TgHK011_003807 [Trichoderma gracile]|nr:hypothetical protein TgHK011_003807 [Trichoderma gracile]